MNKQDRKALKKSILKRLHTTQTRNSELHTTQTRSSEDLPGVASEVSPQEEDIPSNQAVVKKMDADETLRVENLLLRDQIEKITQQLENMRREVVKRDAAKDRDNLKNYLLEKHDVNTKTHKLILNTETHTITIQPLEEKSD